MSKDNREWLTLYLRSGALYPLVSLYRSGVLR